MHFEVETSCQSVLINIYSSVVYKSAHPYQGSCKTFLGRPSPNWDNIFCASGARSPPQHLLAEKGPGTSENDLLSTSKTLYLFPISLASVAPAGPAPIIAKSNILMVFASLNHSQWIFLSPDQTPRFTGCEVRAVHCETACYTLNLLT